MFQDKKLLINLSLIKFEFFVLHEGIFSTWNLFLTCYIPLITIICPVVNKYSDILLKQKYYYNNVKIHHYK